ncbi:MAG: FAD-dependent oxidoreductase [Actinomycetota bacterium]|jgi:glycine/D-amino acid oxidase-like deaminating enzyme|nr:MAG: FAD-dependent oxidoreductase [Actinomycetota bacterium]
MPEVVVVGGGVIGAACADELAARGLEVLLLERDTLAAAASGRNMGLWLPTADPATQPLAEASLRTYLELADGPIPVRVDRTPGRTLLLAVDSHDVDVGARTAEALASSGAPVESLPPEAIVRLDAALAADLAAGWLVPEGRRLDPGALAIALAARARSRGARIELHTTVRALARHGERVTGVFTDRDAIAARVVVVCAGPWSPWLLEPLGVDLRVRGSLGWVVRVGPSPGLPRTLVEAVGWRRWGGRASAWPTAGEVARGGLEGFATAPAFAPHDDGSITIGALHQPWLTPEPPSPAPIRTLLAEAIRVAPAIDAAPVASSRWCVRPTSPDDRPIVGRVAEGLWVATGHGSEGVILGAGTAQLLADLITGVAPAIDPTPFDPSRLLDAPR